MTDNEIIKALECCILYKQICSENCPLCDVKSCKENLRKHCLDLINRQKAEIEKWKQRFINRECDATNLTGELIALSAERDSLKMERDDAIKEFAERVKAIYPPRDDKRCTLDDCYVLDYIDNLVEEMVGDNK